MLINGKSNRFNERSRLRIPLQVVYREDHEREWTQNTMTEEATLCGIGFSLNRPVEKKRLINLQLAMPKRFRLFDYGKEKYNVWGVVRNLRLLDSTDTIKLMVGAALIGDEPPASFLDDPKTLYDLKPFLRRQSFWDLRELPRNTEMYRRSAEETFLIEKEVLLETITDDGQIVETVVAKTLNISESGAAIVTKLKNDCGTYVLIKTMDKRNVLLCVVRDSHMLDSANSIRLHLEFISGKWTF